MGAGIQASNYQDYKTEKPLELATDASGTWSYYLTVRDTVVLVDTSLGVGTLYLPSVSEARGRIFTIIITTGGNALTVDDLANDSVDFAGAAPTLLNAAGSRAALYPDGYAWHLLADHT